MRTETTERTGPLRTGWTTGATATAAAVAAAHRLFAGHACTHVHLWLPRNRETDLSVHDCRLIEASHSAEAGLIKDAGDDPDATHGARVWTCIVLSDTEGVRFHAGAGVGTVTRAGLALAVGEPAINPVPREMLTTHLAHIAERFGYTGGFEVTIGIDNGEKIAENTMNGRLGIVGGLSILGTTGVVRPFSCSAYIASIHQGIDVARRNGCAHLAACTGSTSEAVVTAHYDLPDMALIEMGDFAGAVLKYLKRHPVARVTLVGGLGKFSKLAAGRLDLHSRAGGVDFEFLADLAGEGSADLKASIRAANTSLDALARAHAAGIPLAERVAEQAWRFAAGYLPPETALELWVIDKPGNILARAGTLTAPVAEIGQ